MNTKRPLTLILAIVLLALLSVFGLITPVAPHNPPRFFVFYGFFVGGVGGLIAVFGLWKLQRWGLVLTFILSALSILVTVPGLLSILVTVPGLFLPLPVGKVFSVVLAVLYALVLVLVALPATRKAYAAARTPVAEG